MEVGGLGDPHRAPDWWSGETWAAVVLRMERPGLQERSNRRVDLVTRGFVMTLEVKQPGDSAAVEAGWVDPWVAERAALEFEVFGFP